VGGTICERFEDVVGAGLCEFGGGVESGIGGGWVDGGWCHRDGGGEREVLSTGGLRRRPVCDFPSDGM
jgi:hypothetical protein